jgi:shikimate kinase
MTGPIYLIGYRGVGKTSVARALAAKIGWPWIDADAVLEERAGKTIRRIFEEEGEASFRDRESLVLTDLAERRECIVATGGGAVLRPENRETLKKGFTIWLTAPAEVIGRRLRIDPSTSERRPNLAQGGMAEIESLLAIREPLYRECADVIVDSSIDEPDAIAQRIFHECLHWKSPSRAPG